MPLEAVHGQLLLMVGWSARRDRMCGVIFNQSPQMEGFRRAPLAGFDESEDPRGRRFASPWSAEKSDPLPYVSTPALMERVARAQMHDHGGEASGRGGRLLVAELERDCITTTVQCDLESKSAPDHAEPIRRLLPPARDLEATKLKIEPIPSERAAAGNGGSEARDA